MAGTLAPVIKHQFFDNAGSPAAGHKLFTYASGTTTKQTTWTDVGLSAANTNPIVLDAAGRCSIWLGALTYTFVLASPTDTDPPTSPIWTVNGVAGSGAAGGGTADVTGTAGEAIALGDVVYLSDGSGGKTAGEWYLANAADAYSSTAAASIGMATAAIDAAATGNIRLLGQVTGLAGLVAGSWYYLSAVTPGALTLSSAGLLGLTPLDLVIGQADSTTSLVLSQFAPKKVFPIGVNSESIIAFKPPGWSTYGGTVPGRINAQYVSVGNVGGGEDDLMTYTLPAATLEADGRSIKIIAWGVTTNNANAKTLKVKWGGTTLLTISLTTSEAGSWMAGAEVIRTGAATQRAVCQVACGPAGSSTTASSGAVTAPAENLANAVIIKLTGTATTNDDIQQQGMIISLA